MYRKSYNVTLLFVLLLGVMTPMFASVAGSITIAGAEQSSATVWDTGSVTATINGFSATATYGQYSTPASLASALAAVISQNCNFPVYAQASGSVINFYAKGTNVVSSATFSSTSNNPTLFPEKSFPVGDTSGAMSNLLSVTALSLIQGPPQMGFVITGIGFGANDNPADTYVTLNGQELTTTSWSNNSITVQVPPGTTLGEGNVVVTVSGIASNGKAFTVTTPFGCSTPSRD